MLCLTVVPNVKFGNIERNTNAFVGAARVKCATAVEYLCCFLIELLSCLL